MIGVGKDIVQSIRALAARPGTSVLATLALALGIGLTTTMFSIVQGAFLRGLPFDESDRIMYVGRVNASQPDRPISASTDDYIEWRKTQRSFEDLAAFTQISVVVSVGAETSRYRAARLSARVPGRDLGGARADDLGPGEPSHPRPHPGRDRIVAHRNVAD